MVRLYCGCFCGGKVRNGAISRIVPRTSHEEESHESLSRRRFVTQSGMAALSILVAPRWARAQAKKEIVIGGAASHKAFMEPEVIPMFEKKHDCRVIFEGTKSLVNLEKMVSNRDKPYLSVVMMDDPVLIQAAQEKVIEPAHAGHCANMAKLQASAIHMDGMW